MQHFLAAQVATMVALLGDRIQGRARDERGQTTAEYVGILVFVAVVVVAFIAFGDTLWNTVQGIVETVFQRIQDGLP